MGAAWKASVSRVCDDKTVRGVLTERVAARCKTGEPVHMSAMPDASPGPAAASSPPSPYVAGLAGRCPRCGKASIFDGFLSLKKTCPACGFDLSNADTGDGPAFFASFIGSALLLAVGVWMQVAYEPSFWAYVALAVIGSVLIVGLIRPIKGLLTALQFANKAEQGRFK